MLISNKKVGETPLELLYRLCHEHLELASKKLSYAGRLDPMAEGQMIVLAGDEENSPENRKKFLGLDKEYIATFLVGVKTDSGDALGLITKSQEPQNIIAKNDEISSKVNGFLSLKKQKYPWFSGRAVSGIKLFDLFKSGKTDADIERPTRNIEIKEAELLNVTEQNAAEIKRYIFESVSKVCGDFRQKEILSKWQEFFDSKPADLKMQTFEVRFLVSSGTFIRALTENFDWPVILLKLNRTKIVFL